MKENIEEIALKCPYCNEIVLIKWVTGGGMLRDAHSTLVADVVYHNECWDKLVEEHPVG